MRSNRIRNILVASFLGSTAALAAAPASAQQPYDGLWQVTVVTKSGSCDASTSSTVTVSDGRISGGGLDQRCKCERSIEWQLWIGEMEWGLSRCAV